MVAKVSNRPETWGVLAITIGLLVANVPIHLSLLLIATSVFAIVAIISPLAILSMLLILAPLRTLVATESTIQFPLDAGQGLFVLFITGWAANRIYTNQRLFAWRFSPIMFPLLGYLFVSGLTVFTAFSLNVWLNEWLKWVIMLILILVVMHFDDGLRWQWIVLSLVAAGTANALVGLYIFLGGSGADHLVINGRFFRAFGTFGQPNPFGGFMGLMLPLAIMISYGHLHRGISSWLIWKRFEPQAWQWFGFYSLATGTLLAGLIASWSRGAWLGFLVSVAAMAFALPRKLWQSIIMASTVGILVGALWIGGVIPASIKSRVLSSSEELFRIDDVRGVDITSANYAIVERLAHWQAAQNMARSYPWLGVGLGNYEIAYDEFRLINWDEPLGHAHNYYLNILAEAGMIGLVMYLALWVSIIWLTWQIRSHPDVLARSIGIGLLGSWVYLAVHSLLDNLYVNNLFIHLGVMFGILALLHSQAHKSYQWG